MRDILTPQHGGLLDRFYREYGHKPGNVIDFSINTNAFIDPRVIRSCVRGAADAVSRYPDPDATYLKNVLASYLGITPEHILPGNGAAELIHAAAYGAGRTLIPGPAFSEYERSVRAYGGAVIRLEPALGTYNASMERILNVVPDIDTVFIANPNNPTGLLRPRAEMSALARACRKNRVRLVIDESFMDFVPERKRVSMASYAVRNRHCLVLRSVTKFWSVPGLRLGYAVGTRTALKALHGIIPAWNVNRLAQEAVPALLERTVGLQDTMITLIARERSYMCRQLDAIPGVHPLDAAATDFILIRCLDSAMAERIILKGARTGMLLRGCGSFRGLGNQWIRTAVRRRPDNRKLVSLFRSAS